MLRIVIALVLLGHGIGHILGPLQVFRVAAVSPGWNGESWLLTGATGTSVSNVVGVALWLAAMIGFVVLAGVVMGWLPATWWAPLAVASSVVSLVGIVLFPAAFPLTSTIGAVAVDAAVLVATLWLHWVPSDLAV
jgi:hypothetical protein